MPSTLIPDFPDFPYLPPPHAQHHSIPLSKRNRRTRLTEHRNLYHETNDLSEEEEDVDEHVRELVSRVVSSL